MRVDRYRGQARLRAPELAMEPPVVPNPLADFDPYRDLPEVIDRLPFELNRSLENGSNNLDQLIYFAGVRLLADDPRWDRADVAAIRQLLLSDRTPAESVDNLILGDLPAWLVLVPEYLVASAKSGPVLEALKTEFDQGTSDAFQRAKVAVRLAQVGELDLQRRAQAIELFQDWPRPDSEIFGNGETVSENLVVLKLLSEELYMQVAARIFQRYTPASFFDAAIPYQQPKVLFHVLLMQRRLELGGGMLKVGPVQTQDNAADSTPALPGRPTH